MKKTKKSLLITSLIFSSLQIFGQAAAPSNIETTIHENIQFNNAQHPCITPLEYGLLEKQCAENLRLLGLDKKSQQNKMLSTSLNWPIKAATGFTDCDFYFIGAYVDENTTATVIQDYDCGTNTYDGHHGTDIAAWPYGFYKMDNSLVEVVAAAPGTIIQKAEGNFDRNCSSNNLTANSIIIQHADGSNALYWHMKKNSLTAKTVGQTVVAGEYLGAVGSSGSSSGPHLHFEVWTGNTNTTYNDPFSGTCNLLNSTSWWSAQKPHTNTAVIKASVNTTDLVLPGCPNTETPNESSAFTVPFQGSGLAPGYAKFYIFIRDDVSGMMVDCRILNPNGTTFNSWTYTSTANNKNVIKGYSKLLPTIPGTYTFRATYNGIHCNKEFTIQNAVGVDDIIATSTVKLYPNPSTGKIYLSFGDVKDSKDNLELNVYNVTGQSVQKLSILPGTNEIELNLSPSIYFYQLNSEKGNNLKSGKVLIE